MNTELNTDLVRKCNNCGEYFAQHRFSDDACPKPREYFAGKMRRTGFSETQQFQEVK